MAATSKDGPELHPATVELAQGRNYGAITTVLPSGRLQTHPIWVDTDGERLVVNTETHRQKYKNVERDPNVTLTIRDEENPYRYAEVRGEVVEKVRGQEAREHIDELSRKYHGRLPAREHRERAGDAVDRTFPPDACGPDCV
jgi:PPOX class probable F420-dependent enzyme